MNSKKEIPPMPFSIVVADPGWKFSDKLPGKKRGAVKHYPVMTAAAICALDLPPIADDALLFMWRVSSMVEEAYRVVRAWGFVPKSEIVWKKLTKKGKRAFGMGRYVRMEHETCIVATRGRGLSLIRSHSVRSTFRAKVGRHSEKPPEFYRLVHRLVALDVPRVELFARVERAGYTCFGDELGSRLEAA